MENAIKTAMDWKTRKNLAKGGKETAGMVIHLEEAFHGRTGYTLSLTNTFNKDKVKYFAKFDWPRVTSRIFSARYVKAKMTAKAEKNRILNT